MNYKRKSRRRFFLLMRSRTPPISSEFRGEGGFEPLNSPLGTPLRAMAVFVTELSRSRPSTHMKSNFLNTERINIIVFRDVTPCDWYSGRRLRLLPRRRMQPATRKGGGRGGVARCNIFLIFRTVFHKEFLDKTSSLCIDIIINPLAPEFYIQILAHLYLKCE